MLTHCKAAVNKYKIQKFELYPNPAKNLITLKSSFYINEQNVSICNSIGQKVYPLIHENLANQLVYDISGLIDGIYYLIAKNGSHQINLRFAKYSVNLGLQ